MTKRLKYFVGIATILLGLSAVATPISAQVDNRQTVTSKVTRGDSLNVRRGPGTRFEDIGDIKRNQAVPVLGYDATGKWAKVLWNGKEGWVAASFLSGGVGGENLNPNANQPTDQAYAPGLGPHVVRGVPANDPIGGLALRAGAGTRFEVTQVIGNEVDVFVVSRSRDGNWAFIHFMNGTGYVSTAFLSPTAGQGGGQSTQNNDSFESGQNVGVGSLPNSTDAPDGGRLPAPYTVSNVQSGDVLNIRRNPNARAELMSSFAPNEVVMVLEYLANGWAKVSVGEGVGFVNGQFLSRGGGVQTQNGMQLGLTCNGTEPFWTLNIDTDRTVRFNSLVSGAEPITSLTLASPSPITNAYPFNFAATPYSGTLSQQICGDGMSDIQYGWALTLLKPNGNGGWDTLNGCCSLQ